MRAWPSRSPDHGGEIFRDAEFFGDVDRELVLLVRAKPEPPPFVLQLFQKFGRPLVEGGAPDKVVPVIIHEVGGQRQKLDIGNAVRAKRALDELGNAAADHLLHLGHGKRRKAPHAKGVVQRIREVCGAVDQRSVQVEHHGKRPILRLAFHTASISALIFGQARA